MREPSCWRSTGCVFPVHLPSPPPRRTPIAPRIKHGCEVSEAGTQDSSPFHPPLAKRGSTHVLKRDNRRVPAGPNVQADRSADIGFHHMGSHIQRLACRGYPDPPSMFVITPPSKEQVSNELDGTGTPNKTISSPSPSFLLSASLLVPSRPCLPPQDLPAPASNSQT